MVGGFTSFVDEGGSYNKMWLCMGTWCPGGSMDEYKRDSPSQEGKTNRARGCTVQLSGQCNGDGNLEPRDGRGSRRDTRTVCCLHAANQTAMRLNVSSCLERVRNMHKGHVKGIK